MPNTISPWIKGATPDKPVATNINARKRRYFAPWNLGYIVIKMVNVPKTPIYQPGRRLLDSSTRSKIWETTMDIEIN
jgi:hypothetical protein